MDNEKLTKKIHFEMLLDELIMPEGSDKATELKKELIKELTFKKVTYLNVISYYYDILNYGEEK